ncbi:YidC/Oxa1 family membrane protein insertase [Rhodoblastus acidophilus]|uniref:membrane protein insertase YidC n=1 Tax=Rhodoblastus acidophilus TaxID=1074 RepID=UPI0022243813|nr:membrane protein insertase YidC [Rhodoblastus acidophilus]MCW2283651.1 YidC/Oxa1 family membrane protein insertase [Rhodoblastus acidophilus]MCW2332511.1 YidC/Oxa1 family membrane protein insertase [Rhodoblastus acidophilus]
MQNDQKNLILAMALSLMVIVGWNYFFAKPKVDQARQTTSQLQQLGGKPADPNAPQPETAAVAPVVPTVSRADALAASPRIVIDTKNLSGSLALKGSRLDDLSLKAYRETIDPNSPNIVLLSPSGAQDGYFVDLNYVAPQGVALDLPKADTVWKADGQRLTETTPVTLTYDNGKGLVIKRKISVDEFYMFTVADTVENKGKDAVNFFSNATITRQGEPATSGYAVLHEGFIGVIGADQASTEVTYAQIAKETNKAKVLPVDSYAVGGWLGFTDKYWATAIVPDPARGYKGWFRMFPGFKPQYQTDAFGEQRTLAPGESATLSTRVFAGAKESRVLSYYQNEQGVSKFDMLIDWGWFHFITRPMFWLLETLFALVGNFGVAILLITLIVKILFFPLANKSYASMAKMKIIQPKMKEIQEKYADDKQRQQQEMMNLYRTEKVNPVAGCLPVLLQIPVFFSLYKVLFVAIEMRHAPFFGWIHDLSAPDPTNVFNLFGLINYDPTTLPVFGHLLHLGIWPLIMGVSMWVQMKMNPEPTDPVQKTMFAWMPVIFTFMLGSFPAGLVIYWTWNNLLSVAQQGLIMKRSGAKIELFDNIVGKKK